MIFGADLDVFCNPFCRLFRLFDWFSFRRCVGPPCRAYDCWNRVLLAEIRYSGFRPGVHGLYNSRQAASVHVWADCQSQQASVS